MRERTVSSVSLDTVSRIPPNPVSYLGGPKSDALLEAEVPVFNHRVCNAIFEVAGLDEKLTDTFICAGVEEGGVDACEVSTYEDVAREMDEN